MWCAPNYKVRLGKNWTMGRGENPLVAQAKADARNAGQPITAAIVPDPQPEHC